MADNGKILKWCGKIFQYSALRKCRMISATSYKRKYEKYSDMLLGALYLEKKSQQSPHESAATHSSSKIIILTSAVLVYLAKCLQKAIQECNIQAEIRESYSPLDEDLLHIVLAPMCFAKNMPPRYIAVQMEQTISERWFTPEYISTLNNAVAVIDYSAVNVEYLNNRGIAPGRVFYVPVTPMPHMACARHVKKTPLLFYGDFRCERRMSALEQLSKKCEIKKLINVYRDEMEQELYQSSVIINIHYYEGAMLETTRIAEAMSHNCLIVSETSMNDDEYPELKQVVDFVPVGDVAAMQKRLEYWSQNPDVLAGKIQENRIVIERLYARFAFDVACVLFYCGMVQFETLYRLGQSINIPQASRLFCGNLPQNSAEGRKTFTIPHPDAAYSQAATYAFIARKALQEGIDQLTIEDNQHRTVTYSASDLYSLAQWDGLAKNGQFEKLLIHIKNHPHA